MNSNLEGIKELLKEVTRIEGVSGSEYKISNYICNFMKELGFIVSIDSMNNVICKSINDTKFVFDAHIDEIGMIVTNIEDNGFVKFDKCGGIDLRMLPAMEVVIYGRENVNGVITSIPPHLAKSNENEVSEISELSIDTGNINNIRELISVGDSISFKKSFSELLNDNISANCLDDRCGVVTLLLLARKVGAKAGISFVFTSQEEVGLRGADVIMNEFDNPITICVDVSFAYTPTCNKLECGEIGKGPMIGISPILNNECSSKLISTAENIKIPYQTEVMNSKTGTNADVISVSNSGIITGLVSIPLKYMHSPVEIINLNDINYTIELLSSFVGSEE